MPGRQDCDECWTRYVVALIDGLGRFGANPEIVRDRVFEELAKGKK
jgi:hypothetical protein